MGIVFMKDTIHQMLQDISVDNKT